MKIDQSESGENETKIVIADGEKRTPEEAFSFLNSQGPVKKLMKDLASK